MTLYWEGLDLRPAHGRWKFSIAQGRDELPAARTTSDLIPFRRGRLHKPGIADVRQLELRGYIAEATLEAFRSTADTLKGLLDPEGADPGTLVDDQEDGSQRWTRAVPRNLISTHGGGGTRIMSIELEALDPSWYSPYGFATLDSGLFLDDGEFLDQGAELVIVPTSTSHLFPLTVPGTAECERVRVRLKGASTAAVGIEVGGATPIGFSHPALGAGAELAIDNHHRTATLGGFPVRKDLTLRSGNRHGEYLRLPPGPQAIRITGKPAEARLLFTPTWN